MVKLYRRISFSELENMLRTVPTNYNIFAPVSDYAGNVDLNKSY